MKKRSFVIAACVIALIAMLLCGCEIGKEYTVSFDANYGGASQIPSQTVASGKKAQAPTDPVRDGYEFLGWAQDLSMGELWDFSADKVRADCTLYALWDKNTGDDFASNIQDKDFSAMKTPGSQESAYEYRLNFLPGVDGINQPYVGDPMPYYEDGVFYL